jgi:hypothetical protein
MSSDDGVPETWRPCTRSHAAAINPSAERASAGKKATPVRARHVARPAARRCARRIRHALGVVSNRIIS